MLASWGEIAVVLGAGALLYGPKDLPRVAHAAGRMVGNSRRLTRQCGCPHASVQQVAAPAIALVEKMAGDSLGLYTMIVFLSGFFIGVLAGVLFAVREKAHFD